jgi:hypothetical protein
MLELCSCCSPLPFNISIIALASMSHDPHVHILESFLIPHALICCLLLHRDSTSFLQSFLDIIRSEGVGHPVLNTSYPELSGFDQDSTFYESCHSLHEFMHTCPDENLFEYLHSLSIGVFGCPFYPSGASASLLYEPALLMKHSLDVASQSFLLHFAFAARIVWLVLFL